MLLCVRGGGSNSSNKIRCVLSKSVVYAERAVFSAGGPGKTHTPEAAVLHAGGEPFPESLGELDGEWLPWTFADEQMSAVTLASIVMLLKN